MNVDSTEVVIVSVVFFTSKVSVCDPSGNANESHHVFGRPVHYLSRERARKHVHRAVCEPEWGNGSKVAGIIPGYYNYWWLIG